MTPVEHATDHRRRPAHDTRAPPCATADNQTGHPNTTVVELCMRQRLKVEETAFGSMSCVLCACVHGTRVHVRMSIAMTIVQKVQKEQATLPCHSRQRGPRADEHKLSIGTEPGKPAHVRQLECVRQTVTQVSVAAASTAETGSAGS